MKISKTQVIKLTKQVIKEVTVKSDLLPGPEKNIKPKSLSTKKDILEDRFQSLKETFKGKKLNEVKGILRRVVTEVSIDQLRQQFVDTEIVTPKVFNQILKVTKNKSAYATWMVKRIQDQSIKEEDIYKFEEFLDIFDKNKRLFPSPDIYTYKDEDSVKEFEKKAIEIERLKRQQTGGNTENTANLVSLKGIQEMASVGIKLLGVVDGYQCFEVPQSLVNNKEGWKIYTKYLGNCSGRDTGEKIRICTMADISFFNSYLKNGPYFVFFNLKDPVSPYQFHYESKQFMNKDDMPVKSDPIPKHVYNFFQFVADNTDNEQAKSQAIRLRLRYDKGSVTGKMIQDLPLVDKITFYPNLIKGKDLIINGNYTTPAETESLPDGFKVTGTLFVQYLKHKPTNIEANSVVWNVSSDLYPKSFSEQTFLEFSVNSKQVKELPKNLKVSSKLLIQDTSITKLPENLNVNFIVASSSQLQSLPSKLECKSLNILNTGIKVIPDGVVVTDKLSISSLPEKYPEHLEDVIAINGWITAGQVKSYNKLPDISVKLDRRGKKGKGVSLPYNEIDSEEFKSTLNLFPMKYSNVKAEINRVKLNISRVNNLVKFIPQTLYTFFDLDKYEIAPNIFIYGITDGNKELLVSDSKIISKEGTINTRSLFTELTDRGRNVLLSKLFPESYKEVKPSKEATPIRDLITGPNAKMVEWKIGRKTRGGIGISGNTKDILPSLSGVTQDRLNTFATGHGVTWGDMIVFDNNGSINLIARSNEQLPDGDYLYYDKFGYGAGGNSKVIKGPNYIDQT